LTRADTSSLMSVQQDDVSSCFAPLLGTRLNLLVLGTMPGQKSLQLQQYYAHPRNALWPILCAMVRRNKPSYSIHQTLDYDERCKLVTDAGIGLWDVLASCQRPGSLDGQIIRNTEVPNALPELISQHPELTTIAFNGRMAETLFKRHIQARLPSSIIRIVSLPSTSPAMASLSLEKKYQRWSEALQDGLKHCN